MENLVWKSSDAAIVFTVATAAICFSVYWFFAYSEKLKALVDARKGTGHFHLYGAFYQKTIGVVLLWGIPALVALIFIPEAAAEFGSRSINWKASLYWVLLLGGVVAIVPRFTAGKKDILDFYPQVRVPEWSRNLFIINGIAWFVYLFAYEYLFRWFLLVNIASVTGWWPAIVISTAICSITHYPKGGKETFASIPLSVLLCLCVIQTGSIWACAIIHTILGISNDYWALKFHPKMHLKSARSKDQIVSES